MIKSLTQVGNSRALVIDKSILQAAGLDNDTKFQITVDPNGGIIIQSIQSMNEKLHKESVKRVLKKHSKLFKRLADR